jgi:2-iminobutanoate/2-iminopropanoate deaminase
MNRTPLIGALLPALGLGLALAARAAEVAFPTSGGDLANTLPFSEVVRVDDTYYLSGQIGTRPGAMQVVPGGIEAEAAQALSNIQAVLVRNGLELSDVVKCTVMLADIQEWGRFNTVYQKFFQPPYPARSAFATAGLALGARVEVECLAARSH